MNSIEFYSCSFFTITFPMYPFVSLTFHRDPVENEEVEVLFLTIRNLYDFISKKNENASASEDEKITLIIDTYGLSSFQPILLGSVISFVNEIEPLTNKYVNKLAICVYSSISKKIVDFVYLFKKTSIEWVTFSSQEYFQEWYDNEVSLFCQN